MAGKAQKLPTNTPFLSGKMFADRTDANHGKAVDGSRRTWWQIAEAMSDDRKDENGSPLPAGQKWTPSAQGIRDIHDRAVEKIRQRDPGLADFLDTIGRHPRRTSDAA